MSPKILEGAALPPALRDLPEPPARLFLHGLLPSGPSVAIVGTRIPSPEARNYAEFLSSWLAARGIWILSGGAKGIDAAAHVGALQTGQTVVVAPSSFDRPFPAAHRSLYEEIVARGGGYLSRFDRDVPAKRHYFLDRNRLLVALGDAVILVEAPPRSGARNAGRWARRLGRPYFVVPSVPWNERGRGCILELQLGARALGSPDEVMRALEERSVAARAAEEQAAPRRPRSREPQARGLPPSAAERVGVRRPAEAAERRRCRAEIGSMPTGAGASPSAGRCRSPGPENDASLAAKLLDALDNGARYASDLVTVTGASLPEVQHELLLLTLSGDIEQGPGGALTTTPR